MPENSQPKPDRSGAKPPDDEDGASLLPVKPYAKLGKANTQEGPLAGGQPVPGTKRAEKRGKNHRRHGTG